MTNRSYILNESLTDTVAMYMVLKRLLTPFTEWDAFKMGIIDKDGKKLKDPITSKERESWDILSKFVWNFKKILSRFLGPSRMMTYLSAAYLLKDSLNYYVNANIDKLHEKYLQDMTYEKQNLIYQLIKHINKPGTIGKITEENFEMQMFHYLPAVERAVESIDITLLEDGPALGAGSATAGTSTQDIAQQPARLKWNDGSNRTGPAKRNIKRKKKFRRVAHESPQQ
jgi:hypothetical protein